MHEHTSSRRRRLSVGTGTAALSLGLCLCAGQLISTPAANAATPVVAQAAVAKVTPKITDSVNTTTVTYGSQVRVTTKLIDPKTGKVVTSGRVRLQAYRNGGWQNWSSTPVGRNGYATLYGRPYVNGSFRTVYLGNGSYNTAYAKAIYVRVRHSGDQVLSEAKRHVGALYKFAAAGPSRFDCSGYTQYVYKKSVGRYLPHNADAQQRYGSGVSKGNKQVGDLIIFRSGSYGYHAAIYAGNGYMYDSPHTGARVAKRKIWDNNYVVRRLV